MFPEAGAQANGAAAAPNGNGLAAAAGARPGRKPGQVVKPPEPMTVSRAVGRIEQTLRTLPPDDRLAALGVASADAKRAIASAAKAQSAPPAAS